MAKFGEPLKRERESRNISLREIAETTKINIRYLEALEEGRFGSLPGGIFNRGFIRAYANYLGIDGEALVRDYLDAMAASGLGSAEGALPRPDQVAPRAPASQRHGVIMPEPNGEPPRSVISMGPDPTPAGDPLGERPGRRRRYAMIAVWILIVGALLTGSLLLRRDRSAAPRSADQALQETHFGEPTAEGEGFEPPEGMFVDAGPAEGEGVGETEAEGATEDDEMPPAIAAPPPEPGPSPEPRPAADERQGSRPADETPLESAQAAASEAPPPGPMALQVEVTRETWLWLACDSRTEIDRRVTPGETTDLECLRSIRVSAHDAGAVRLRVNGASCMALGDDGSRVYGYTIRFDDAHLICRARS